MVNRFFVIVAVALASAHGASGSLAVAPNSRPAGVVDGAPGATRPSPTFTGLERPSAGPELPQELVPLALTTIQNDASSAYDITARRQIEGSPSSGGGPQVFQAANAAHGLDIRFDPTSVRIARAQQPHVTPLRIRLTGYGTSRHTDGLEEGIVSASGNRVELARALAGGSAPVIREWYVNGPLGLEQGVTILQPAAAEDGTTTDARLQVEFEIDRTWVPSLTPDAAFVTLTEPASQTSLRYGHLYAWDAAGRALPVELAVEGQRIMLRTDAAGAQFPLTIDPLIYEATLTASDGAPGDLFGYDVAIDGDTAVVGAPGDNNGASVDSGSVHVFVRTNAQWVAQAKLVLPGDRGGDGIGGRVALSGNTLLTADPLARIGDEGGGVAYVFERSGTTWTGPVTLVAEDRRNNQRFGESVALDGSTAVIGATGAESAAYVFVKSGSAWSQQAKLMSGVPFVGFGQAVAVGGDVAVIGAPYEVYGSKTAQGSAYIFDRSGTSWSSSPRRVTGSDATANSHVGIDVDVDGDTILVGATGAVYVFSAASAGQQAKLTTSGTHSFGFSVGIHGDRAIVGAQFRNPAFPTGLQGAAYVFERTGSSWAQTDRLTQLPPTPNSDAGYQIGFDGDTALLGSWNNRNGTGAAFVYALGTASTPPPTLQGLVSGQNVQLRWTTPPRAVASYVLEVGASPGATSIPPIDVGASPFLTAANVARGNYYVRVRALFTDGTLGDASNEILLKVPSYCRMPFPLNFTAGAVEGTATLSWDPVVGATEYIVEAGASSDAADITLRVPASTTRVSAQAPPGVYFVRVRAVGFCGSSAPSLERRLRVGGSGATLAVDDTATTPADEDVTLPVLANDSVSLGGTLSIVTVTQPPHGTADANPDGTITYSAFDGFVGNDQFSYTVEDERGGFDTGTVTVNVTPPLDTEDLAGPAVPASYWLTSFTCAYTDEFATELRLGGSATMQEFGKSGVTQMRMNFKVYREDSINIGALYQTGDYRSLVFADDAQNFYFAQSGEVRASSIRAYRVTVKMVWARPGKRDYKTSVRLGTCNNR